MLPVRVLVRRTIRALEEDPASRRRLVSLAVVIVLVAGVVASGGFTVTLRVGRSESSGTAANAVPVSAGPGSVATGGPTSSGTLAVASDVTTPGGVPSLTSPAAAAASRGGAGQPARPQQQGVAPQAVQQAAAPVKLVASDQGVTEKEIKLGFLISAGSSDDDSSNPGLKNRYTKIAQTWSKEVNRQGGIHGRQVVTVVDSFSVFSEDDMIRACKKLTKDEKVFSVIAFNGFDGTAQLCIAKDGQTPLISPDPEPAAWYQQASPYLWTAMPNKDRILRNYARWLRESGLVDPAKNKVGVMYHGIPRDKPSVEETFLPELKRLGITPVEVAVLSPETEKALQEINTVVLTFNRAGVDRVLMPTNLIFKSQFMTTAENQQYFPKYSDSDMYQGGATFTTSFLVPYPAKSFDRTRVVTSTYSGVEPGKSGQFGDWDSTPFAKFADQTYARHFPCDRGVYACDEAEDPSEAFLGGNLQRSQNHIVGQHVWMWREAALRSSPNLTRIQWGQAMGGLGRYDYVATAPYVTFSPDKHDGADVLAVIEWHAEASGGYDERSFRQVQPHAQNWY